ncbi:unnamed protein product [Parnassius apollo]|uniref:(apollo) hypothetical protein n=1 Tax=Parnassius apollo TaxID=110799 RepID=A0A8S3X583_PARAO|nr:unnamed protein product [Parnassius apollo]
MYIVFFLRRKGDKESMEHKYDMNINKLVAEATGVSARTVMRIVAEGNSSLQTSEIAKFSSPRKPKEIKKRIQIDDFDMGVIRRKIHQFYTSDKKIPSIRKLLAVLKEDGIVNCGCTYLRQLLHKMGYLFKKCKSKRHILIERPSIAEWRVRDQELLSNDVEISGITELGGENLMSTVTVLSTKLGITLDKRDIVNVERVGLARRNRVEGSTSDDDLSSMRPRIIAVRFAAELQVCTQLACAATSPRKTSM